MDVNEVIRNTIIWDLEDSLKKKDAEIEQLHTEIEQLRSEVLFWQKEATS